MQKNQSRQRGGSLSRSLRNHIPAEVEHYQPAMLWKSLRELCSVLVAETKVNGHHIQILTPLLAAARFLKELGYEVRSHNTNARIPAGHLLIPYAFPTLNPKSVQLYKEL